MELSGTWRRAPLDAKLNRVGLDPDLDDSGWDEAEVPGHWAEGLDSTAAGPFLYRRSFNHRRPEVGERFWLCFDGVLSTAEVWLDGDYLGDTVGYFAPNRFEITDQLARSEDHLLAVDVACPPGGLSRDKVTLTGSLQSGPLSPGSNPGGIWRPVRIERTGPITIRHSRALCTKAESDQAEVQVRLVVEADAGREVPIRTVVVSPGGEVVVDSVRSQQLAAGENRVEWTVAVDKPELWWPAALQPGRQPRYGVAVEILSGGEADEMSDRASWLVGLRTVSMNNLHCVVNGQRLFTKSIAYGPASPYLGSVSGDQVRRDARAIAGAGLDMVRVYGHVARPEFYDEADRLGLLVWQDMPLVGGYSSKVRGRIREVARALIDQVGHHPSVAVWGAHCEPDLGAHRVLPNWTRTLLDPLIARELRSGDPTRATVSRSGSLPSVGEAVDSHLWLGWRTGRPEDLADHIRRWPRLGTFPGGIGSQSATVEDWPLESPDPSRWSGAEADSFNRYLPRAAYPSGAAWAEATRAYQVDVLRTQIETLRRLKYNPTGGFCLMAFADAEPGGGFGIVDFDRHSKPAMEAVIDACRPVIVVAETLPSVLAPNQRITIALHTINDLTYELGPATITATARCGDWSTTRRWEGLVDADDCVKVADFVFTTPSFPGTLIIDLELMADDQVVTNRYQTVVIPKAETVEPRRGLPSR